MRIKFPRATYDHGRNGTNLMMWFYYCVLHMLYSGLLCGVELCVIAAHIEQVARKKRVAQI